MSKLPVPAHVADDASICGKTTVLRVLNHIARRPKRTGSISPYGFDALCQAANIYSIYNIDGP